MTIAQSIARDVVGAIVRSVEFEENPVASEWKPVVRAQKMVKERVMIRVTDTGQQLHAAYALHQQGRLNEAERMYRKVLKRAPNDFDALFLLGLVYFQLGRFEDALRRFNASVKIRPRAAEAMMYCGMVLQSLGRDIESISAFDRALALKSDDIDIRYNRAYALQAMGRLQDAIAAYDSVIAVNSNHVFAFYNRGNAWAALEHYVEAVADYDRALALDPGGVDLHLNRGNALSELGRFEEAVASYRRAGAENAAANMNLGHALAALGRYDEALASLDRAQALQPENAPLLFNKGRLLMDLGRLQEARAHFEQAVALDPKNAAYHFSLGQSRSFAPGDPQIAAMEELARDAASLPAEDRIQLHFALGKAYADCKDYERSLSQLMEGNALKRAQVSYDEAARMSFIERVRGWFTAERLRELGGRGNPSPVPVFVVGMARSGTTLIEQILASHPDVHGAGEREDFNIVVSEMLENRVSEVPYPDALSSVPANWLHELGTKYLERIGRTAPEAKHITDKMPENYSFAGLIHLALPSAKIIHVRRDALDTCMSCFGVLFTRGHAWSYDLGELGRYYRSYLELMDHWRRVLPEGAMLEVDYENVVADLEGEARRIVTFCGLEWDARCLAFYEHTRPVHTASVAQVRQPIYRSSIGRWQPYRDRLAPLLEALEAG